MSLLHISGSHFFHEVLAFIWETCLLSSIATFMWGLSFSPGALWVKEMRVSTGALRLPQ